MFWRSERSMVVSVLLLVLELTCHSVSALEAPQAVEVSPSGKAMGVAGQKKGSMIRRHETVGAAGEAGYLELDRSLEKRFYSAYTYNSEERREKAKKGLVAAGDAPMYGGGESYANHRSAPAWAPHPDMPVIETCTADVDTEMGLSDYGTISHNCASCTKSCTEENAQNAVKMSWVMDPPLEDCNAFKVKFFANWTDIGQLDCSRCQDVGLKHKFEFDIKTNAGEGYDGTMKAGYEDKEMSFKAWMGPEVQGSPGGNSSAFEGYHVFEVEDTELPSNSDDCDDPSPSGRWIAIPGELRFGEGFTCERTCKLKEECKCKRMTGMRCTAPIFMGSGQLFAYEISKIADSATASIPDDCVSTATHKCDSTDEHGQPLVWQGAEWQVTARDLSDVNSPALFVGRVVLVGLSGKYGIRDLRQSHQHLGCVPCDLFYESTVVSGPYIENPPDVHVVKTAEAHPPTLTSESCELFRLSSLGGYSTKFETGPGLWPPFEVNDTIFTCGHVGKSHCNN